ncbi:MAG: HAMP domain-containing histidine kinase [Actinomycetota bacterium]|nr:HAMP domain-containing histidine kinase [Actinomycetota bacterium]
MTGRSSGPSRWLGSIRVRILAVVVVMLVVSSIGSVLLLRAVLFERLEDEVDESLRREAEEFGLLSTGNNPETGEPFAGDLRAVFDVYFAREVPDEGESLLAFIDGEVYRSERAQDAAEAEDLQPAIEYWLALDEREQGVIDTALGNAKYIAMPLTGQGQDGLYVVVNFPRFERREIASAVRTQIVVQLVTMVLVSALGLLLAGRVLRPLASLARTAPTISDTDLTQRIPVTGRDEASKIARAFNEMLTRLEGAFDTQKRFLHDTSHELRTPLTVIRGHVELLELDTTEADRQATIDLVTDEIDRMSRIVNDLFLLAMSERPDFLQVEPVDLREIVVDAHQKVTALGVRDWQVEAPAPVRVVADAQRLTQAITQLAANAVKYTDEDDTIRIGATARDGMAMVWVEDSGPGVSTEDAERIFERFGRAGQARDPDGGAGLGLAIVQAIAEAHGGSVQLRSTPGAGARFEILIPTDRSSDAGS